MGKCIIGIYKIENILNNKIYIGQSNNIIRRWNEHKSELNRKIKHNPYFINAWHKYGEVNFSFEIIEECSEDLLSEREMYYINLYNSFDEGYNATVGGEGTKNIIRSEEWKRKQSEAHSGEKNPMYNKKRTFTAEHKENIKNSKLNKPNKSRKISDEMAKQVKQYIKDNEYSLREISNILSVNYYIIKDIKQQRSYKEIKIEE